VTSLVFSYRRLLVSNVRAKEVQEVSLKTCYVITSDSYLHHFTFCNVVLSENVTGKLQPSLVLQTLKLLSQFRRKSFKGRGQLDRGELLRTVFKRKEDKFKIPALFCVLVWNVGLVFLGAFGKLRKATISFVMSVRPSAWNNTAPTGRIFMKSDIWVYRTIILPVVLYGCETWSLTLRDERRLRGFENRVLRKVFGPKRDEVTGNGENYIMRSLVICTPYPILCGW
jgi:hypothetical protein